MQIGVGITLEYFVQVCNPPPKGGIHQEKIMNFHVAYLVVLIPVLLSGFIGFFAFVAPWFKARMESKEFVEVCETPFTTSASSALQQASSSALGWS